MRYYFSCRLLLALIGLAPLLPRGATAQTPAPPLAPRVWPIRTIEPTDTAFADLLPLAADIGAARVVFLGEPSHGEGPAFMAQTRLVNFLQRRMGFTVLAFESGFYDLAKAQQQLAAGADAPTTLAQAIFPIWTETQEFQPLLALLGQRRLQVAGFDTQFSGSNPDDLADDLQAFLAPEPGADKLPFEPLAEAVSTLAETQQLPPDLTEDGLVRIMQPLETALRSVAARSSAPQRQPEARFWLQCLANLRTLAALVGPKGVAQLSRAQWKGSDTNQRDAQMADNLLFILRQNPTAKVICWGASGHFANRVSQLQHPEMATTHPMGEVFRTQYPGLVYSLAVTTAEGSHGAFSADTPPEPVPVPAAGSLEAYLARQRAAYGFVSLRHELPGRVFTSSMFEYTPIAGIWSEVFDGVLYLRTVTPTHAVVGKGPSPGLAAPPTADAAAPTPPAGTPTRTATGRVLDARTGQPLEFVRVQWGRSVFGSSTDAHGRYALEVPTSSPGERLTISCVGYAPQRVAVEARTRPVRLHPASYGLAEVQVSARRLDARRLLDTAIERIPRNYRQQEYNAHIYNHATATNLDSVLRDVEYTALLYDEDGYRDRQHSVTTQVEEVRWNQHNKDPRPLMLHYVRSTFELNHADALTSPLFARGKTKRFALQLLPTSSYEGREVYVIEFRAKRLGQGTTGDNFLRSHTGRVYLDATDYAIVRCEMRWERDTLKLNKNQRRYYSPATDIGRKFRVLATQNEHGAVITYQRTPEGQYFPATCTLEWTEAGYDALRNRNARLHSICASTYYNFTTTACQPIIYQKRNYGNIFLTGQPYHPLFWQGFVLPGTAPAQR